MTTMACECCWLRTVQVSAVSHPSRYCSECERHAASLTSARLDHKATVARVLAIHADEVARERELIGSDKEELAALRVEYDALVKVKGADLANVSESTATAMRRAEGSELEKRIRDAYYTRNRAMDVIWTIDERHHALPGDKCACALPLHQCEEYRALDFFRDEYERWERKQIELMKAGKSHGLPENHPEARKLNVPSYEWRGMRSTEPDQERRRAS